MTSSFLDTVQRLIREDREQEVLSLLESAASEPSPEDLTALLATAIHCESASLATRLIDRGADPRARIDLSGEEWPILFIAVDNANLETVRLLLERGADVRMRDSTGLRALMLAIDLELDVASHEDRLPSDELSSFLIGAGADIHAIDSAGNTALDVAVRGMHVKAEQALRRLGSRGGSRGRAPV